MAFFSKLRERLFKSKAKLDEGLDALVEEDASDLPPDPVATREGAVAIPATPPAPPAPEPEPVVEVGPPAPAAPAAHPDGAPAPVVVPVEEAVAEAAVPPAPAVPERQGFFARAFGRA
ncbi:MAG: signal recognition particle-docking protein FtsY, partial [Pseudomonadota bacterium]